MRSHHLLLAFSLVAACSGSASSGDPSSAAPPDAADAASDASSATDSAGAEGGIEAPDGGGQDADATTDANASSDAPLDGAAEAGSDAEVDASADADAAATCVDLDGDGYGVGAACLGDDCDDANPLVNPAMAELADDGLDNDCSGGDLTAAVGPGKYVDVGAAGCSDTDAARGSKATPYCSLAKAVLDAYQNPPVDPAGFAIFVAKGTYPHVIGWPKSMRLYGGYDAAAWTYAPVTNPTIIGGATHLDDLDSAACRASAKGCNAMCPCIDWDSWISVNTTASSVVQGFTVQGGARPGAPIRAITVNSSGRVVFADMRISAGAGLQNVGMWIDRTATNTWLIRTKLDAGTPSGTGITASAFGLVNHGAATLWGATVASGPGVAGSSAVAVQNWGTMRLAASVLNPGDQGGAADYSYGLRNDVTTYLDTTSSAGTVYAVNDVIFAGRGAKASRGVFSNSPLTLVDSIVGDRTPSPLDWSMRPTENAIPVDVGFASKTWLRNNLLVNLLYTSEPSPPNALANRHLFVHSAVSATYVEDIVTVNACGWTGCQSAGDNFVATAIGFVDPSTDYHVLAGSPPVGNGTPTGPFITGGLGHMDIDGQLRPAGGAWDVGVDER